MGNTQVFLPQEHDGLPPEDDKLVGVLSLKLVDELDEVAVTVLAKVLGAKIRQLILGLDTVDDNLALLRQLLNEKVPQRDMIFARTVGSVAGDVQRLSMYSGTLPKLSSKPSSNIMSEKNTASFIVRATVTSSASIVDCAVSPCNPTSKLIGALASITMYDDVDLPLLGLLPQLASKKAASLKPPCL